MYVCVCVCVCVCETKKERDVVDGCGEGMEDGERASNRGKEKGDIFVCVCVCLCGYDCSFY